MKSISIITLLASTLFCGCGRRPAVVESPQYTNSFAAELAVQIEMARLGYAYGRANVVQSDYEDKYGSSKALVESAGLSYSGNSIEDVTNAVAKIFWQKHPQNSSE